MAVYSHSRLSTFEQCRLRFKYQYLDKIEPLIKNTVEAFLGSIVHDTLEKLYVDLKHSKLLSKEELLGFLENEWKKNWSDDILIVRKEYSQENYLEMAKKYFSDYYDSYHPFDQATVIGTEILINMKLDEDGKYLMRGYVDRLDCRDGVYEIHDYKTARNLPLQEYLDEDRQLALYAIAIKKRYSDVKDVKLIWHFLAFNKELDSERNDEQLEKLKQETIRLIQEVEAAKDFPPTTSALCGWCGFRPVCPKWRHLFKTEEKSAEEFRDDDGVKLVDEYAKLKSEEKELAGKIEQLKNRILAFSKKEGVDALFGSDSKVNVWRKECFKFPSKDDSKYGEFVDMVKKLGLWEEFSRIDSFRLEKALENKEFHKEIQAILEKFARKELVERLYPAKK